MYFYHKKRIYYIKFLFGNITFFSLQTLITVFKRAAVFEVNSSKNLTCFSIFPSEHVGLFSLC